MKKVGEVLEISTNEISNLCLQNKDKLIESFAILKYFKSISKFVVRKDCELDILAVNCVGIIFPKIDDIHKDEEQLLNVSYFDTEKLLTVILNMNVVHYLFINEKLLQIITNY